MFPSQDVIYTPKTLSSSVMGFVAPGCDQQSDLFPLPISVIIAPTPTQ